MVGYRTDKLPTAKMLSAFLSVLAVEASVFCAEGNETVTNCNRLKMRADDGKMRLTDCLDTKGVLRLVQSVPSPKAEPCNAL